MAPLSTSFPPLWLAKPWRTSLTADVREKVGNWEDAIAEGMELNRLYFWGPSR